MTFPISCRVNIYLYWYKLGNQIKLDKISLCFAFEKKEYECVNFHPLEKF